MQSLDVAQGLFPLLLCTEKTSSIRFEEQRIEIGPITCYREREAENSVTLRVYRCTDMPLSEAAASLDRINDWPDDVMLEAMRAFYPDIEISDKVQVIEHLKPQESLKFLVQGNSRNPGRNR